MRGFLITLLVGCTSAPTPTPVASAQPRPIRPRASYLVRPGELGDRDVLERMPHRVRLLRYGPARLRPVGAPIDERSDPEVLTHREVVPVLGESRAQIRVVSDLDDARIALWIDRADAAKTITLATRFGDEPGRESGVWLAAGVDVDFGVVVAGKRDVTLRDAQLRVFGMVSEDAIGTVWVGRAPTLPKVKHDAWLAKGRQIRSAPASNARVLAELVEDHGIRKLGVQGPWVEVELDRPGVRVRGFVPVSELATEELFGSLNTHGRGSGFGMSGARRLVVPGGVCLYDQDDGEVIGVTVASKERYTQYRPGDEWHRVYVSSWWGTAKLRMHDPTRAQDSAQARWESCLEP